MCNTVTVTETQLIVEPSTIDKVFGFHGTIRVPLAQVEGARIDPDLRDERKGWRGPGLRAPGKLTGTFHADGYRQFWNIVGYDNAVVIELAPGAEFTRIIVSVDDPQAVVAAVQAAIGGTTD